MSKDEWTASIRDKARIAAEITTQVAPGTSTRADDVLVECRLKTEDWGHIVAALLILSEAMVSIPEQISMIGSLVADGLDSFLERVKNKRKVG